ncbi:hypothetical protein [Acinetobacter sp. CFCC 10889]|uniref:hypothetical protein n=1 Tax=Acinetobacter sp. CFCC 10889 TaxID=1775557 RepID=UPI000DCFD167|nr:hypothetical protein [Acinetobacter sp. CFCC 10889]
MKKICFLLSALTFSTFSFAQDLSCKTDYPKLEKQMNDEIKIIQTGTVEELIKHYQDTDYAQVFRTHHAGQVFDGEDWIDEKAYLENTEESFNLLKDAYSSQHIQFHAAKANFLADYGEVCVIPISAIDQIYQEKISSQYDVIFVRDLKTNQWRNLVYSGVELKTDMDEFFPNLSKKVKLAAFKTNDGQNYADLSEKMAYLIFPEIGISMTKELKQSMKEVTDPLRQRLKANGF